MLELDGNSLTLARAAAIAAGASATLADAARARVAQSRRFVEQLIARDEIVYGINTGFGKLSEMVLPGANCVPCNSISSARTMMLYRANTLAKGYSGCRPVVIDTLLAILNAGVHPVIPSRGSVGASGDLAPLAHLALVTIGEGEALYQGTHLPGGEALQRAGIAP